MTPKTLTDAAYIAIDLESTWACIGRHLERLSKLKNATHPGPATARMRAESQTIARSMLALLRSSTPDFDAIASLIEG